MRSHSPQLSASASPAPEGARCSAASVSRRKVHCLPNEAQRDLLWAEDTIASQESALVRLRRAKSVLDHAFRHAHETTHALNMAWTDWRQWEQVTSKQLWQGILEDQDSATQAQATRLAEQSSSSQPVSPPAPSSSSPSSSSVTPIEDHSSPTANAALREDVLKLLAKSEDRAKEGERLMKRYLAASAENGRALACHLDAFREYDLSWEIYELIMDDLDTAHEILRRGKEAAAGHSSSNQTQDEDAAQGSIKQERDA